ASAAAILATRPRVSISPSASPIDVTCQPPLSLSESQIREAPIVSECAGTPYVTFGVVMVKFLIGLVTGVALVFVTIVLLFFALLRFRERPPQIADNAVLVLRLEGQIPEKPPVELPAILSGDRTPATVAGVWMALKKAAVDPH